MTVGTGVICLSRRIGKTIREAGKGHENGDIGQLMESVVEKEKLIKKMGKKKKINNMMMEKILKKL